MSLKLNLCLKKHGIKLRILEWILRWISSTDHYKSQLESSEIQKNFQVILFCLYFYIEPFLLFNCFEFACLCFWIYP